MQTRRFNQTEPLDVRLVEQAARLRKEAQGTYPGIARDNLIRQAQQLEVASQMQEWVAVPDLRTPR